MNLAEQEMEELLLYCACFQRIFQKNPWEMCLHTSYKKIKICRKTSAIEALFLYPDYKNIKEKSKDWI